MAQGAILFVLHAKIFFRHNRFFKKFEQFTRLPKMGAGAGIFFQNRFMRTKIHYKMVMCRYKEMYICLAANRAKSEEMFRL